MVNVYLDNDYPALDDLVYMTKEQNILNIKSVNVLSDEEYSDYKLFIDNIHNM